MLALTTTETDLQPFPRVLAAKKLMCVWVAGGNVLVDEYPADAWAFLLEQIGRRKCEQPLTRRTLVLDGSTAFGAATSTRTRTSLSLWQGFS